MLNFSEIEENLLEVPAINKEILVRDLMKPKALKLIEGKKNWDQTWYTVLEEREILDFEKPLWIRDGVLCYVVKKVPVSHYAPSDPIFCKYCKKRIKPKEYYFQLWTPDDSLFIAFHFRCSFKENTGEIYHEINTDFRYRYDFNTNKM